MQKPISRRGRTRGGSGAGRHPWPHMRACLAVARREAI